MSTPEGKVKAKFKRWMEKHFPSAWIFMPVQMGYGVHGVPDFICCVPMTIRSEHVGKTIGIFFSPEAKADGGTASKYQIKQMGLIANACGITGIIEGTTEKFMGPLEHFRVRVKGK